MQRSMFEVPGGTSEVGGGTSEALFIRYFKSRFCTESRRIDKGSRTLLPQV